MMILLRRTKAWLRDQKLLRKKRVRLAAGDAVILSMSKSGRTWLNAMLSHYFHVTSGTPANVLLNGDNLKKLGFTIPSVAFTHGRELEGQYQLLASMRKKPTVFLFRNPRDVAVSMYFQRIPRRTAIGRDTLVQGEEIAQELTPDTLFDPLWLPLIIEFMNRWRERFEAFDRVMPLPYEVMRADPTAALMRVLEFIEGAPASKEAVQRAVEFASFENLRKLEQSGFFEGGRLGGGRPGEEGTWKVRRGKVGGFADYFGPADIARINAYVAQHLHPSFGYAEHA